MRKKSKGKKEVESEKEELKLRKKRKGKIQVTSEKEEFR